MLFNPPALPNPAKGFKAVPNSLRLYNPSVVSEDKLEPMLFSCVQIDDDIFKEDSLDKLSARRSILDTEPESMPCNDESSSLI